MLAFSVPTLLITLISPTITSPSARFLLESIINLIFVVPFITGASIFYAHQNLTHRGATIPDSLQAAGEKFVQLFLLIVLLLVFLIPAFILLIVPGLYLSFRWSFVFYAVIIEGYSASDALSRSWKLTKGHWWLIFRSALLFTLDELLSDTPSPSSTNSTPVSSPDTPVSSPTSTSPNTPNTESNDEQLDQLVKTRECRPPNEAEYVFGDYKLGWTFGGERHEGLLQMKGRIGKMRIQYFDEANNKTDTVDQTMVLASCTKGLIMLGFNPVIADTNQTHPTYVADNLIYRREINGDESIENQDDSGVTVPVEIEEAPN